MERGTEMKDTDNLETVRLRQELLNDSLPVA